MFNIILRGGRLTKYNGKAASFAPGLGVSSPCVLSPDIAAGAVLAPVLGRIASALGTTVSARALATRALAVAFATVAPLALTITGAEAGACTGVAGVYTCSGPANDGVDITQTRASGAPNDLTVTTQAGFGIDTTTTGGNAFRLTGNAGSANLTFTDNYSSAITGAANGIGARNNGTGFTSITTTGVVTGTGSSGILAYNSATATSLIINAQGAVIGGLNGISAQNNGTGALSITSRAVTGAANSGILARNDNGTSLTINAKGRSAAVTTAFLSKTMAPAPPPSLLPAVLPGPPVSMLPPVPTIHPQPSTLPPPLPAPVVWPLIFVVTVMTRSTCLAAR